MNYGGQDGQPVKVEDLAIVVMRQAQELILNQRHRLEILEAESRAYRLVSQLLNGSGGMVAGGEEDIAWKLGREMDRLRARLAMTEQEAKQNAEPLYPTVMPSGLHGGSRRP